MWSTALFKANLFDAENTINHDMLLYKLEYFHKDETPQRWFIPNKLESMPLSKLFLQQNIT